MLGAEQIYQPSSHCDSPSPLIEHNEDCYVKVDYLDSQTYGDWDFELQTVYCRRVTSDGSVDCNLLRDVARYTTCCHALPCDDPDADYSANSCWGCPEDYDQIDNCCYAGTGGGIDCHNGESGNNEGCYGTPIIIDTAGNGFALTDARNGVNFDLNSDGIAELLSYDSV